MSCYPDIRITRHTPCCFVICTPINTHKSPDNDVPRYSESPDNEVQLYLFQVARRLSGYNCIQIVLTVSSDRSEHVPSSAGFAERDVVHLFVVRDQLRFHVAGNHVHATQNLSSFEAPTKLIVFR